jgi:hypothetical protein
MGYKSWNGQVLKQLRLGINILSTLSCVKVHRTGNPKPYLSLRQTDKQERLKAGE